MPKTKKSFNLQLINYKLKKIRKSFPTEALSLHKGGTKVHREKNHQSQLINSSTKN